jgi:hypothetical protein
MKWNELQTQLLQQVHTGMCFEERECIGSLCMLIASHLERERSNLVEEIVAMEEAPIYYVQAKGAAYWRRCGQPVLSGRAWCSNWKAGLELERLVASICVSWVPVD